MLSELSNRGERGLPPDNLAQLTDQLAYLKHRAMYTWARTLGKGGRVLDLGCGEGYGSQILAESLLLVFAVDYSPVAARHAQSRYGGSGLNCLCCDGHSLAFDAGSFDLVISFEVIEHLENVTAYLEEVRRILAPDGIFVVSTPNRKLRLLPFQRPWNPHHRREYTARQFGEVLRSIFPNVELRGLAAVPEVVKVEKRRLRQAVTASYTGRLARALLPPPLHARLRQILTSGRRTASPQQVGSAQSTGIRDNVAGFGFDSFFLVDQRLDDCLNLVGICT